MFVEIAVTAFGALLIAYVASTRRLSIKKLVPILLFTFFFVVSTASTLILVQMLLMISAYGSVISRMDSAIPIELPLLTLGAIIGVGFFTIIVWKVFRGAKA